MYSLRREILFTSRCFQREMFVSLYSFCGVYGRTIPEKWSLELINSIYKDSLTMTFWHIFYENYYFMQKKIHCIVVNPFHNFYNTHFEVLWMSHVYICPPAATSTS